MAGEILDNRGRGDAHWQRPSIHPEGRKFGLITAAACLVCAFLAWETIAWPLAFLIFGVLAFFLLGATLLRAEGVPSSRVLPALGLSLVAPLLVALTLWAIAPGTAWVVDALVLDTADMAPSLAIFGAGFGAFIGALFGALLGIARALLERYDPDRRVLGPRSSSPLTLGRGGRSRGSA